MNPFRNPKGAQQASNQDATKSMAAEEGDLNFKKNPCRSVCIRVLFRCDVSVGYDEGLIPDCAAIDRGQHSIAIGHGLHG